jgi:hypothetical protein
MRVQIQCLSHLLEVVCRREPSGFEPLPARAGRARAAVQLPTLPGFPRIKPLRRTLPAMDDSVPTFDLSGLDERMASERASLRTLIPFAVEECLTVGQAATLTGKSQRTIRNWCVQCGIGRRIGGAWAVSKVALQMVLEGDQDVLSTYHDGARAQCEPVASYYRRFGLGDLLRRPEFGGDSQEEPPQLPQSPQKARLCGSALAADPHDDCPPDNREPNAERSGLVEPDRINPDTIVSLVADDPKVKQAMARLDRATPSTHYDLVRARDEAQARMGIPIANRAFLYSAEVDDYLLPIVVRMWPGHEAAAAQAIRRDFDERYGDLSLRVLAFCLGTFQHGNIDGLKRAAGIA